MAEGTEVVPEAVREFGKATFDQMGRFSESLQSDAMPVMSANLGASGMPEGRAAAAEHAEAAQSAVLFARDVTDGLLALTYTAATVAQNYERGDTSQQAQMASVQSSFEPPPGVATIVSERAAQAAAAARADARLAQLARRTGEDLTPDPTWADGPAPVSTYQQPGRSNPYTAAADDVQRHKEELAALNHDTPSNAEELAESKPVKDEGYDPAAERQELEEEAADLNRQTGLQWDVETDRYGHSELVVADTPPDYTALN